MVLGNMMLSMFIFAISDKKNMNLKPSQIPFAVSLVILALNVSLGSNCGAPLNPARDFAPRYFIFYNLKDYLAVLYMEKKFLLLSMVIVGFL